MSEIIECRDEAHYLELRRKNDRYETRLREEYGNGPIALTPEQQALLPPSPTNAERSAIETWEFIHDPPDRYFAYVKCAEGKNGRPIDIHTWTGQKLGDVIDYSPPFNVPGFGMGSTRQAITVKGINGYEYVGTYYRSSGDYCRLRLRKSEQRRLDRARQPQQTA